MEVRRELQEMLLNNWQVGVQILLSVAKLSIGKTSMCEQFSKKKENKKYGRVGHFKMIYNNEINKSEEESRKVKIEL